MTAGRGPRDLPEHGGFAMEARAPVCPTPQGTVGTGVWGPSPLAAPGDSCHHLSEGEDPGWGLPGPRPGSGGGGALAQGVLGAGVT